MGLEWIAWLEDPAVFRCWIDGLLSLLERDGSNWW